MKSHKTKANQKNFKERKSPYNSNVWKWHIDIPKGHSAGCAYGVAAVIRDLLVVVWNNISGGRSIDGCGGG